VAVVARHDVCIGSSASKHDLSGLKGHRLRTHGGTSEAKVPFIVNRPLNAGNTPEEVQRNSRTEIYLSEH
ncbi:MAG TPA: hypothetical protein PLY26_00255, partial [Ferruginibacter sp.]|nr:hypothetical protein [Ferruginibacter sp.]